MAWAVACSLAVGCAVLSPVPTAPTIPEVVLPPSHGPHVGPASLYPDPDRTPGVVNPNVTQDTLQTTICLSGWTATIRPPSSYTTTLKKQQMAALHLSGSTKDYEEDHFIALELGGHPTSEQNLWPEPYLPTPGARQKDRVENFLHDAVCHGVLTLQQAQELIVADWYAEYQKIGAPAGPLDSDDDGR
jgi:hypothetical protein